MTSPGVAVEPDERPDAVPGSAGGVGVIVGAVVVTERVFLLAVGLGSGSKSADLVLLRELPVIGL